MTNRIVIHPADLHRLWNADNGLSVALLLDWLTPDEKARLAQAYADWLDRRDVDAQCVLRSFQVVRWKLEEKNLDLTDASRRVRELIATTGTTSRLAIIAVLMASSAREAL